ncbi:terminase large subunit [Labrys sp. (in: a-proteobacteria)]|uniref:terminase large subunit n=1 Tax=Labrys sp. (in: a-proteobacteria) TaxID=1917972 RepID=UPI0039E27AB5
MVDLSCRDWFAKLQAGRPPLPDNLPLDAEEARAAVAVFEKLRLPDVPGKPLLRDAAGPWAKAFVSAIFGLVDMSEDRKVIVNRKVRRFVQLVPKKNSKTTNSAAIMLTALLRNRRPNAEFLLVGPTQDTAGLAYDQADGMVGADPWLKKRFHTRDHLKTIEDRKTGATLQIKSFDNRVMTGQKPVGVLVDELHELGKFHYAQKVMAQIDGGILANPEGFVIIITTQSDDPPTGVFAAELEHARQVRDGELVDGETLPMLYEFPIEIQAADVKPGELKPWEDPKLWPLVLPNLGRSITIDRLLPKFREAKAKGIEAYSIWASQHLNVQIGIAITGTSWRGAHYWLGAADIKPVTLETIIARCEVVTAGVDGGGLDDLLGLAVIGRERGTQKWLIWFRAWAHDDVFEERKEIVPKLEEFIAEGSLTRCKEPTQDIEEVADVIEKLFQAGLLPEEHGVGFDPFGVSAMVDELAQRQIFTSERGGPVTAVSQGFKLMAAIKGMERKLKDGTLKHGGQALASWCVSNAKAELKGSSVVITKQAAGWAKIDPLVAAFNAFTLMARNPEAASGNIDSYVDSLRKSREAV